MTRLTEDEKRRLRGQEPMPQIIRDNKNRRDCSLLDAFGVCAAYRDGFQDGLRFGGKK